MAKMSSFFSDQAKIDKGIRFPHENGFLIIASIENAEYDNAMDIFRTKYPTEGSRKSPEADKEFHRIIARHLLLGWEGFDDMPYSFDNACLMLAQPMFRQLVFKLASDLKNFRKEEEVIKN